MRDEGNDLERTDRQDIEDAIETAIDRTVTAQEHVAEEIEGRGLPEPRSATTVVRRADDVYVLVHDAADEELKSEPDRG